MKKKEFLLIAHRGYGKPALPRHTKSNKKINVSNTLTGFEMGIERGANALEIDLCLTGDEEVVTHHLIPGASIKNSQAYLKTHPEALTLNELSQWFSHQDKKLILYLELKSYIPVSRIADNFEGFQDRIVIYTQNKRWIKSLISEKQQMNIKTGEIKISFVTNALVTRGLIEELLSLGNKDNRMWAIEQGMMPWGFIYPIFNMKILREYISKCIEIAGHNNIMYLVGTINNAVVAKNLIIMGINGIVPDNPAILKNVIPPLKADYYIPPTCKKRLTV